MNNSAPSRVVATLAAVLALLTPSGSLAETESLSAEPLGLTGMLREFSDGFVAAPAAPIEAQLRELMSGAAVSALVDDLVLNYELPIRVNLAEAARIDRQLGGGSSSAASTRLAERTGNNATLGFAIENGAARQEPRVTQLTLSSSLYGLIVPAAGGDTQRNFDRFNCSRRFGFSFTFDISNTEAAPMGGANIEEFSEFGARIRIVGDRSTRTARFREVWREMELPRILELLSYQSAVGAAWTEADEKRLLDFPAEVTDVVRKRLEREYEEYGLRNPNATEEEKQRAVYSILFKILMKEVYEPVSSGELLAGDRKRRAIIDEIYPSLRADLLSEALRPVRDLVSKYNRGESNITLDYALHRIQEGSDFSELKLVYQNSVDWLTIVFNANVNLNHHPSTDPAATQRTVREFGATLELNGTIPKVFSGLWNSRSNTLALSGGVSRLEDLEKMLFSAQVSMDLPVVSGFTIPIAMSYSSRTETSTSDEFKVTIGGGIELDAILATVRARDRANRLRGN